MKITPQESDLNTRLKPSKFSANGFMAKCDIPIEELIAADQKKLDLLGIPTEVFTEHLELVYSKAEGSLGAKIAIKANFFAKFFESRGKIPSPFTGHGTFDKGETVLTNSKTGKYIVITRLGIDMIKVYSFFQGHGSRYRINPVFVAEFINA